MNQLNLGPILMGSLNGMHAQALTLAVLSGAAVYHYYEKSAAEENANSSPNTKQVNYPGSERPTTRIWELD
ncbi:hypothetical protein LguiB_003429 [Lonicera macranthoides]